jgi:hypothetical protein
MAREATSLTTARLISLLIGFLGALTMSDAANARGKAPIQSDKDPADMKNESPKKKDGWDRAQIISGFISSVVIAIVGILINDSIQRAQLAASKARIPRLNSKPPTGIIKRSWL